MVAESTLAFGGVELVVLLLEFAGAFRSRRTNFLAEVESVVAGGFWQHVLACKGADIRGQPRGESVGTRAEPGLRGDRNFCGSTASGVEDAVGGVLSRRGDAGSRAGKREPLVLFFRPAGELGLAN